MRGFRCSISISLAFVHWSVIRRISRDRSWTLLLIICSSSFQPIFANSTSSLSWPGKWFLTKMGEEKRNPISMSICDRALNFTYVISERIEFCFPGRSISSRSNSSSNRSHRSARELVPDSYCLMSLCPGLCSFSRLSACKSIVICSWSKVRLILSMSSSSRPWKVSIKRDWTWVYSLSSSVSSGFAWLKCKWFDISVLLQL